MNTNKLEKLVKLSRELIHKPSGPNKHFSFILFKNEIISIGFNSYTKTHTKAVQYGYPYGFPHSELDAILKAPIDVGQMVRCRLINIRLDNNGLVKLSKQCPTCSNL